MAETKIQWTATPRADGTFAPGYTFNSWIGCAKVSPGCKNCYAAVDTFARVSASRGLPLWGEQAARHVTSDDNWRKPLRWNREAAAMGERRKVFCASLSDVFEARDDLDPHRARLWELIEATPALDWLLLTKRPEEIMQRIPERWRDGLPASVWVGTTVENQEMAEARIPHLLRVPARIRFLSCEPLLDELDLSAFLQAARDGLGDGPRAIDQVIIGGESGPKARPLDLAWARKLVQQCLAAGVKPFVKQLGAKPVLDLRTTGNFRTHNGARQFEMTATSVPLRDRAGGDMDEWPEDLRIRQFPEVST